MTNSHSDALVFFGATGDLAYKKIFPSLQAMVKRGHLKVPVAAWPKLDGPSISFALARKTVWKTWQLDPAAFESSLIFCSMWTVTIRIHQPSPAEGIALQTGGMVASQSPRADEMDAYEGVLGAEMDGDSTLFAREEYVERRGVLSCPYGKRTLRFTSTHPKLGVHKKSAV